MNSLFDDIPDDNPDGDEGERRKDEAFGRFESTRGTILLSARRALLNHLLRHGEATADDVRRAVALPPGINPKCFGCVPSPFAKAGMIEADGLKRTQRAVGHARPITVWRLKDATAANDWLAQNPEPQTPDTNP